MDKEALNRKVAEMFWRSPDHKGVSEVCDFISDNFVEKEGVRFALKFICSPCLERISYFRKEVEDKPKEDNPPESLLNAVKILNEASEKTEGITEFNKGIEDKPKAGKYQCEIIKDGGIITAKKLGNDFFCNFCEKQLFPKPSPKRIEKIIYTYKGLPHEDFLIEKINEIIDRLNGDNDDQGKPR